MVVTRERPLRGRRLTVVAAVEIRAVSKSYVRGTRSVLALDDVSLSVAPGECVALVGRSGSGKSTLLHLAGALDVPDAGTVRVDSNDVGVLGPEGRASVRRRRIGFVFQFFNLLPTLTVEENVTLPLLLEGRRVDRARVLDLLDQVALAHKASSNIDELSGGEMQRVAVARALIADPAVILADEPTGNLDSATGNDVLDLLIQQVHGAGAAMILVTHDAAAAARADRIVTLRDGRIE